MKQENPLLKSLPRGEMVSLVASEEGLNSFEMKCLSKGVKHTPPDTRNGPSLGITLQEHWWAG